MKLSPSSVLKVFLAIFGSVFASSKIASSQVTPDNTDINTQVNQDGNVAEIKGGQTTGGNLFHSFQDFSLPTGNEAFFNNANDISNIFSRVTGGNISDIDGLIRANGSASLFLINPAGIIFGENARLDIGGSFYGSTASSILFENEEFSAVDLDKPPLLTINAPIGLGFQDNPGDIVNRSFAQNDAGNISGLEVASGQTLAFVGGNINFEAGEATALGGNIYLGGLAQAGMVDLNENGSPSFPENLTLADVILTNNAIANVAGIGGGNVTVNAQNLSLEAGELGKSVIFSGIRSSSTSAEAQAGDITIDVAETITLDDSAILNQVAPGGIGNSGNIIVNAGSMIARNGGQINASTFGQGNAGAVNITAIGDITVDGEDSQGIPSGITSVVNSDAVGDAGGVTIFTSNLNLTNGGQVDVNTADRGNAGAVNITATGDITVDGEDSEGIPSGITSIVNSDAVGDAGGVTIFTSNLNLTNGGRIDASTGGQGNAGAVDITATGDITIDGEDSDGVSSNILSIVSSDGVGDAEGVTIFSSNLNLTNGGRIDASTGGQGNAGAVNVTATGDISIAGKNSQASQSSIRSIVSSDGVGDAGGVTISTSNLNLTSDGRVDASTFGTGNAGAVNITATGDIVIDGGNSDGSGTGIGSIVSSDAVGDSGGVTISTTNLNLTNGGLAIADTFSQGNAGAVNITATGDITVDGEDADGSSSDIRSVVASDAEGDSGGVTIFTSNLNLINGGRVSASTGGQGNAGAVKVTATGDIMVDGETSQGLDSGIFSAVLENAEGDSGGVTISTTNLNLTNGGSVDASTFGRGNAGDININSLDSILISSFKEDRVGISANAVIEDGNGGNINIATDRLTILNNGIIEATNRDFQLVLTPGTGLPGNINIKANTIELNDGAIGAATQSTQGVRGNINLEVADSVTLKNNSFISAEAFGEADGGNLNIDTNFIIAFPGDSNIIASAEQGQGGNININAESLFGIEERPLNDATNDINASSEFSIDGEIEINTPDLDPTRGITALPDNVIDASQAITRTCLGGGKAQESNKFIATGRGGLPTNPNESLSGDATLAADWVSLPEANIDEQNSTPDRVIHKDTDSTIVEAKGWKVNSQGKVILTAKANSSESAIPWLDAYNCETVRCGGSPRCPTGTASHIETVEVAIAVMGYSTRINFLN